MSEVLQITPFIFCSSLKDSIAFYENCLGFAVGFLGEEDGYAFLRREGAAIRLLQIDGPIAEQMVYIDVRDIDGLWDDLAPKLDGLEEGRVRGPFDRSYNQREIHVKDGDGTLLMFGEPIKA